MKLRKIKIFPRGSTGWASESLEFAQEVTQLYGPNGCGKTPLIQAMVYCLGYPCVFREDIYQHCSHAQLDFEIEGRPFTAERAFSKDFEITLRDSVGEKQNFYNEKDYSAFLFDELGLKFPSLISNADKLTSPYLATVLPIFYLDQDEGYSGFYCAPSSFIKDQFSEMVRILLDLPAKNSFEKKKNAIDAKRDLDYLDQLVHKKRKEIETIQANTEGKLRDKDSLEEEITSLKSQLNNLKDSGSTKSASVEAIDELISRNRAFLRQVENEAAEIDRRNRSIFQIIEEIQAEINTLNLNEEARRVFSSFNEVCSAEGCQLFSFSSDSYAKNLLYLRDQIKDLERNTAIEVSRLDGLKVQAEEIKVQVAELVDKRTSLLKESEVNSLIEAITQLTKQIFNLEMEKKQVEQLEEIKNQYVKLLNSREEAQEIYDSYSTGGASNPKIVNARAELRGSLLRWLDILDTNNVSNDISFKDDFVPVLGNETLNQLKGSTRIRVVLAYHAALMELLCGENRCHFKFLILDTPKQHEMHDVDLGRYLNELKKLANKKGFQIIFSATEYRHKGDERDIEWTPTFPGKKQKMFLKAQI